MTIIAGILAIFGIFLYISVMHKYQPVYYMLGAAGVLGLLGFAICRAVPKLAGYIPVIMSAILASAAAWGSLPMVNQIGYVIAKLDPMSTIMTYIYFMGCAVVGMILCIVASFLRMAKSAN